MSAADSGLRERKKQRTREAIIESATRLFLEHGFEGTTVADIAEAAEIAPRTFFGYFATKEDVVFHDFDEVFASLERRIRERPAGESAFEAVRSWILTRDAEVGLDTAPERARRALIRSTPALAARDRVNMARFEDVLAAAVAEDLDVPAGSLRPHLVAAAAVAALDALSQRTDAGAAAPPTDTAAVLDEALVFLRGGLEALRRHPPA